MIFFQQLGDRLAAMLNHNLYQLCGPKYQSLKVKNPEKYHFKPKELLDQLTDIYLNLDSGSDSDRLLECVVADGRNYSPELWDDLIALLVKKNIKSMSKIEQFKILAERCAAKYKEDQAQEQEWGDFPEEFQDPMLYTMMKDPVLLPSGHIVDRNSIMRHLLSDQSNPFNRERLTESDLKPATELKEKIDAWIAEKKKAKRN